MSLTARHAFAVLVLASPTTLGLLSGCRGPSTANITLRKQQQDLQDKLEVLERRHASDEATIKALHAANPAAVVPTLPPERLAELFTVHGLKLGRLTGGADLDRDRPGDEGIKVYAVPTDDAGDATKAAGSFAVELFDLAATSPVRLGRWDFDTAAARLNWYGSGLLYTYVLPCPWQLRPGHADLLVRVSFTDALTGRTFTVDGAAKLKTVPGSQPAADPTTRP